LGLRSRLMLLASLPPVVLTGPVMFGYTREQLLENKIWEIGPFKDTKASKVEFRELSLLAS
jgi:hypothetical protein